MRCKSSSGSARRADAYPTPERVHGPAGRSIPVVAVSVKDDILYGGMVSPPCYAYCGD